MRRRLRALRHAFSISMGKYLDRKLELSTYRVSLRGARDAGRRRRSKRDDEKLNFDLLSSAQTTRSPNLFEISPRPFGVTTSPLQNRAQFGQFGQRPNSYGFTQNFNNFPSAAQQQPPAQRQNPYLDTTGFGEVIIALFRSIYLRHRRIGTVFSQSPQYAPIIFSAVLAERS